MSASELFPRKRWFVMKCSVTHSTNDFKLFYSVVLLWKTKVDGVGLPINQGPFRNKYWSTLLTCSLHSGLRKVSGV